MSHKKYTHLPVAEQVTSAPETADPMYKASAYEHEKDTAPTPEATRIAILRQQGFPNGLACAVTENSTAYPLRVWVVDNSGSMNQKDGHSIKGDRTEVNIESCTRWTEMQELVGYHVQMAGLLSSPTIFRMLNDPGASAGRQQFSVADKGPTRIHSDVKAAEDIMQKTVPDGWATPLTFHLTEIRKNLQNIQDDLARDERKLLIIIATDGLPTNLHGRGGEHETNLFIQSLQNLKGLPVSVIVRLCTDDTTVVNFYSTLNEHLPYPIVVLDDFLEESRKVHVHNRWLNYALPLHRCRELGLHNQAFYHLASRKLTKAEVAEFCTVLFEKSDLYSLPDAKKDWEGFLQGLKGLVEREQDQWNAVKGAMMPWISISKLQEDYDETTAGVMWQRMRAHKAAHKVF